MEEEPTLENYIVVNDELRNQVDCLKIKQKMMLEQLHGVKNSLKRSLFDVEQLEGILRAPI